jgi:hypothetical protein
MGLKKMDFDQIGSSFLQQTTNLLIFFFLNEYGKKVTRLDFLHFILMKEKIEDHMGMLPKT